MPKRKALQGAFQFKLYRGLLTAGFAAAALQRMVDRQAAEHEAVLEELAAQGRELPRDLRAALTTLDARVADDLEPVHAAKHELQSLLDAETHDARCDAFSAIVRREKSRLLARKGLRKLFGGPEVVGKSGR